MSERVLQPVREASLRDAIMDAIANYELAETDAWNELDALSAQTTLDSIEANPDGLFKAGVDRFEATATVYVVLNYGDKHDSLSVPDSYPAHVAGKIVGKKTVRIDEFTVDTSSFYGGNEDPSAEPEDEAPGER